jgi:hypothetical protein
MPGRRLTITALAAIAALGGASAWTLLGRLGARLRVHDDLLAGYAEMRGRDAARLDALYDALDGAYGTARLPVPPGVIPFRDAQGLRVVRDRTEAG